MCTHAALVRLLSQVRLDVRSKHIKVKGVNAALEALDDALTARLVVKADLYTHTHTHTASCHTLWMVGDATWKVCITDRPCKICY